MVLDNFRLDGRVALVTGASRGLGEGVALALAEAGADLVLAARSMGDLERVADRVRAIGRNALTVAADVTDRAAVERLAAEALRAFERVDVLVNNAGIGSRVAFLDLTDADWDRVMRVNLHGAVLCSQAVGRHMVARRSGKIINVASVAGLVGRSGLVPYATSKGALLQLTRSLALEWARHNVQVNAICPGYFRTDMNAAFLDSEAGRTFIAQHVPVKRPGRVEELGPLAVFLASPASDFITGTHVVIDGGRVIR
jgi:NAD(P)-dependent dehydrogenase (short-subunit alcohol dehydrogenase family)